MTTFSRLGERAALMSAFINSTYPNDTPSEVVDWRRVTKVSMEAAEALEALAGSVGENFRKGVTHGRGDVLDELLDTAFAALCAVEHIIFTDTPHERGQSANLLELKARKVLERAGIDQPAIDRTVVFDIPEGWTMSEFLQMVEQVAAGRPDATS